MKAKKLFILVVLLLSSVSFVACNKTTTEVTTTAGQTTATPTTEAPVDLSALMTQLKAQYADTLEDMDFVATEDLTLVTTIGGFTISYSSSKPAILENDGTIHRPLYSVGDQTAVLTATITQGDNSESYDFYVTVKALDKSDQERADEAFVATTAFPVKDAWTSADNETLNFSTTAKDADDVSYTVVWTSSHPDIISPDGVITQPEDAAVLVTMTATITINEVNYTATVDFNVAKLIDGTPVDSIAAAYALYKTNNADEDFNYVEYVEIPGVTVVGATADGVYITDGTDVLYVYGAPSDIVVGQVYDVTGQVKLYYNAWEMVGEDMYPIRAKASTAAVSEVPYTVVAGIGDIVSEMVTPSYATPFSYKAYTVTAKVYYDETWGNYSLFLTPVDYDFDADLATGAKQPNGDSIMIYYKSNDEALRSFVGKSVTVDIIMQGYRTDLLVWYAIFLGEAEDVELAFENDAEAVATAAATLDFPKQVIEDKTFELVTGIYGTTISYASTNEAIFNPTTGVVDTTGLTEQTSVTVTATVTLGEESMDKTFTILVGPLPMSDISDAYSATAGELIKVQGILTTDIKAYQYFFQDATAGISLDVYSLQDEFGAIAYGSEIVITAEIDISNGLYELVVMDYEVLATTPALPTPASLDGVAFTDAALLPYQGQMVSFTGFVLDGTPEADSYGTYQFYLKNYTTDASIMVRIDNRSVGYTAAVAELMTINPGDEFVVTGAIMGWYYGFQLLISDAAQFEVGTNGLSAAQKLALDVADLPETLTLNEDMVIVSGEFGSTFTLLEINGNAANYLDATTTAGSLLVTQPYGVDVTGSLTIKLDNGSETETVVLPVVIENMPLDIITELFISEYGEGSSNNKWLEIYNGTGAAVDLSGYTVEMYSNGATTGPVVFELTGTLADGETYVIANDGASDAIKALADIEQAYPSVVSFNGDDCVVLTKNGVIIDAILEVGHTNDDYVVDEVTLVRKATILGPNAEFSLDEWDSNDADYITNLGTHTVTVAEITDAQKLGVDKAGLNFGGVLTNGAEITLPALGTYGSTITWAITTDAGSNATLVDGVLTLGAVYEDATVVITATLSLGEETDETSVFTYKLVGLSGAERVALDKTYLENMSLGKDVFADEVITLPLEGPNGSAISWAITTDEGSSASLTGGALTLTVPETEGTVVVTATLTSDTATDTVVVTYTLKNYPQVTLENFVSQTLGDTVIVTGNVYAVAQNGFFIEDGTGFLFVFDYDAEYVVGDEVQLQGVVAEYHGSYQLSNVDELTAAISTGNDVTQTPVVYEEGVTTLVPGQTYTVLGTVQYAKLGENTFYTLLVKVSDTLSFEVYYKSPQAAYDLLALEDGKYEAVNMVYYNNDDLFVFVGDAANFSEIISDFSLLAPIADDVEVYLQGVIAGFDSNGIFLQDTNGLGIYMFRPDGYNDDSVSIGDQVIYFGELNTYGGTRQLNYGAALITVIDSDNTLVVSPYTHDELVAATPEADGNMLASATGLVVTAIDNESITFTATHTDTSTVDLKYYFTEDYEWLNELYEVNDLVDAQFILDSYYSDDSEWLLSEITIMITDQEKFDVDVASIPATMELAEDFDIPESWFGATYTVTSIGTELTAYVTYNATTNTLEIVQPEGADVVGNVTVTVAKEGFTSVDVVVELTVKKAAVLLYSTGFETADGFTASTTYNSTLVANNWTIKEGTVTTTGASAEDMQVQMRDYSSVDGFPYAQFSDGVTVISTVVFNSNYDSGSDAQLTVQFSVDGVTWSTGTTIDLTDADATYEVDADAAGALFVRFVTNHSGDANKQKTNLDDIKIY